MPDVNSIGAVSVTLKDGNEKIACKVGIETVHKTFNQYWNKENIVFPDKSVVRFNDVATFSITPEGHQRYQKLLEKQNNTH